MNIIRDLLRQLEIKIDRKGERERERDIEREREGARERKRFHYTFDPNTLFLLPTSSIPFFTSDFSHSSIIWWKGEWYYNIPLTNKHQTVVTTTLDIINKMLVKPNI